MKDSLGCLLVRGWIVMTLSIVQQLQPFMTHALASQISTDPGVVALMHIVLLRRQKH